MRPLAARFVNHRQLRSARRFVVPPRPQAHRFPHLFSGAYGFGDALGVVYVRTSFGARRAPRSSPSFGALRSDSLDGHLISSLKTRKGLQKKGCICNPRSAPTEAELRQGVVVCQGSLVPSLW